jgi:hypothetical protein
MIHAYYAARGLSSDGLPSEAQLAELRLGALVR